MFDFLKEDISTPTIKFATDNDVVEKNKFLSNVQISTDNLYKNYQILTDIDIAKDKYDSLKTTDGKLATVIFDMDKTLVYGCSASGFHIRPFLFTLMNYLFSNRQKFRLIIWSAGEPGHLEQVFKYIFEDYSIFDIIIARGAWFETISKNIKYLCTDDTDVVMFDDDFDYIKNSRNCSVLVKPYKSQYFDYKADEELENIIKLLDIILEKLDYHIMTDILFSFCDRKCRYIDKKLTAFYIF